MSFLVWVLFVYAALTMTLLARSGGIPVGMGLLYCLLSALALAAHGKTSLTDPGAVPASAVPTAEQRRTISKLSMCSQCQTFKPPQSHHCRICNRCVSRMVRMCVFVMCVCVCNVAVDGDRKEQRSTHTISLETFTNQPTNTCLYTKHAGPSLPLDEQLCRCGQFETLFTLFGVYLDLFRSLVATVGVELLFLCHGRMRLRSSVTAVGPTGDILVHSGLFVYQQYAHECHLWHHDGNWYH